MYVAGVYRPLNTPLPDLIQFVTNTLEYTDNLRAVLVGDFNIDVLCTSNAMRNYSLINKINFPTYVTPST